jgi:inner membrane protein
MDSLSQIALGSAVGLAVMGRRTAAWKPALWGAIAGTLPDLDVVIDYGDAILDMTRHRAESHALFYLTLLAPPLAAGVAALHGERALWRRWWLALWLVLITHPLLDWMTVYGTQLLRPFSDRPLGVGSVFIIDPLYTLPLLVGVVAALRGSRQGPGQGLRWNTAGLVLSTLYLAWGVAAQQQVRGVAEASLREAGIANVTAEQLLVTPTPFNSVLWRVVAMTPTHYLEGYRSLLDTGPHLRWTAHDRGAPLMAAHGTQVGVARIAAFSQGFFRLRNEGGRLVVTDLRMGQEPNYIFGFEVGTLAPPTPGAVGHLTEHARPIPRRERPDLERGLPWLWQRLRGNDVPLPPPVR